jgi:uncharacterized protein YjbI with pentapeptide repeats
VSTEAATTCGRQHGAMEPNLSADSPVSDPQVLNGSVVDADGDLKDVWLSQTRLLALDLDRPEFLDVRLDDCDLSGINATDFISRRMHLSGTRMRGVMFAKGQFEDSLIVNCSTSELSFRFSRLKRVVFRDCDLSGADFYGTTFEHVTMEGCDLQRAQFDAASSTCLAISNCQLGGVTGVTGLRGALIDASDLPAISLAMAGEIGIKIRDN